MSSFYFVCCSTTTAAPEKEKQESVDDCSEDEEEEAQDAGGSSTSAAGVNTQKSTESQNGTSEKPKQEGPARAKYVQDMQKSNSVARTGDEKRLLVARYALERVFRACKFPDAEKNLPIEGIISKRIAGQYNVLTTDAGHISRWPSLKKLIIQKVCSRRSSVVTAMRNRYCGKLLLSIFCIKWWRTTNDHVCSLLITPPHLFLFH